MITVERRRMALHIEDNRRVTGAVSAILADAGHRVVAA